MGSHFTAIIWLSITVMCEGKIQPSLTYTSLGDQHFYLHTNITFSCNFTQLSGITEIAFQFSETNGGVFESGCYLNNSFWHPFNSTIGKTKAGIVETPLGPPSDCASVGRTHGFVYSTIIKMTNRSAVGKFACSANDSAGINYYSNDTDLKEGDLRSMLYYILIYLCYILYYNILIHYILCTILYTDILYAIYYTIIYWYTTSYVLYYILIYYMLCTILYTDILYAMYCTIYWYTICYVLYYIPIYYMLCTDILYAMYYTIYWYTISYALYYIPIYYMLCTILRTNILYAMYYTIYWYTICYVLYYILIYYILCTILYTDILYAMYYTTY